MADCYVIERELGRGGMATVYLARDLRHDRRVALKVIPPETASVVGLERFLREIRVAARLAHPHVLPVLDSGEVDGLPYYTMPFVEGESLRVKLEREKQLPLKDALQIASQVADALSYAHQQGVVHRDIKPENILLEAGHAVVSDFGLARALTAAGSESLTGSGLAIGTPAYMSPEQATGGPNVDSRADIYALGCVLYEMLAGQPPFMGATAQQVMARHATDSVPPLRTTRPSVPFALEGAVMKALAKVPADRWQTADEFRQALDPERFRTPSRRRRWVVVTGVAVLLAVAVAVSMVRRQPVLPTGLNPRHSILVLPFDNLREDRSVDWLRHGSVSMLTLNLSQWNDLTVVDYERLHDLLTRHDLKVGDDFGLEKARRLAREAGAWTLVLGDFTRAGDSLQVVARVFDVATGKRVEVARVDDRLSSDIRPLFDQLAAKLLDLSGAPKEMRIGLTQSTTESLEAFRAYLSGIEHLNRWDLARAEGDFRRAIAIDSTFSLAYYKVSVVRSWVTGAQDAIGARAIERALEHAERLPMRERTLIRAYHSFIANDQARARSQYQRLIARDSTDADAWYWLGETWLHDTAGRDQAVALTQAIRAFRRTLDLDPDYGLAYDHVQYMVNLAAGAQPFYALVAPDSFAATRTSYGAALVDSLTLAAAVQRARSEAISMGRHWVETQSTSVRAHEAMVEALLLSRKYEDALAEVNRFRAITPHHPGLPFVEASINFAAGKVDQAAVQLRTALDTMAPHDFRIYQGTPTVILDVVASANVFAYQGDLAAAGKAIEFADRVRREVVPVSGSPAEGLSDLWKRTLLSQLYGVGGVPTASLRQIWLASAEAARMAPAERQSELAYSGAAAAIGLFTGPAGDSSAISELRAITGRPLPKEVRALLALTRHDSSAARSALAEPDTAAQEYLSLRRVLAAEAHYLLGEDGTALRILKPYEPEALRTRGFDSRWGILGRVRLLRASMYERLGRPHEARQEYGRVISQWKSANDVLGPFLREAEEGIARLSPERR